MLIRSQDKDKIINLQNIGSISIRFISEDGYVIDTMFPGQTGATIAHYSTEEKAIKVLDMIQNAYADYQYSKWVGYERETVIDCIFEMPHDDEVKA